MKARLRTILSEAWKAIRILFLEVLGALFILLCLAGFGSSWSEYRRYLSAPAIGTTRLTLTLLFAAAMLFSGLHSFWKARKIRQ